MNKVYLSSLSHELRIFYTKFKQFIINSYILHKAQRQQVLSIFKYVLNKRFRVNNYGILEVVNLTNRLNDPLIVNLY